ncbi:MAG: hypothetical protein REI09_04235 [Candidatus Dactylopiibacterium sp.]|nr:hypothetical protein [Candidatus Dactylopiibacterium sp.]
MSRNEVEQRIGPASEIHAHASGGGLIPFYPGSGWNTESHYIGEGRLWFSADSLLILIDAREPAR